MPLIGEGSYGCIFRPYVNCKIKTKRIKSGVGKIFIDNIDFQNEKSIQEKIDLLDPKYEFTVPLYTSCDTNKFIKNDQAEKCTLLDNSINNSHKQLIYKYGGKDFKSILKLKGNINKFMDIFIKLRPILLGIKKLYENNYVHQDIKPANILFDGKKISLIDFGIVTHCNKIYTQENTYVLKYNYPYYPPEYKLFIHKGNFNSFYSKTMNNFKFDFLIGGRYIDLVYIIRNIININIKEELNNIYNSTNKNNIFEPNKIDLYSVGIVILELYIWSNLYNKTFSKNSINEQLQIKLTLLIKSMIRFDSRLRENILTIINIYDDIIKLWNNK